MERNITSNQDYDCRLMEKFAKVLRKNKIAHKYYRKDKTLIIQDGYFTVFKLLGGGYWNAYRIDCPRYGTGMSFTFPANTTQCLILKCARYRLIPFQKLAKIEII